MSFKLWLEAVIAPNIVDDIKTKLDTDEYASIFIHGNGIIDMEYPDYRSLLDKRNSVGEVSLNSKHKSVNVKDIATKITPQTQKLIKALLAAGVIDDTWKVDSKHITPGEYAPRGMDWMKMPSRVTDKSINDLVKEPPFTKISKDLTLYHGTSAYDWENIQKQGALKPLFVGAKIHGFESRAKHQHNKNHIYLATNEDLAWHFAKARSQSMSRKHDPEGWKWLQYNGPARWPVKPVLLQVSVPDIGKLRADDDVVNTIMRNQSRKIWNAKPAEEKQRLTKVISRAVGFDVSKSSPEMLWRETDRGFKEILSKLKPEVYKAYMASILKSGYVAYDGIIPLKFIKEIPFISRNEKD